MELVIDDNKPKHFQLIQRQPEEEKKSDMPVAQQEKPKKTSPLEGNLAMKFLLKSGDFDSLLFKGKKSDARKQTS